jgi:HNH endonuclease
MTVGHRIPQERGGSNNPDNLRTECSRCNEPMRYDAPDPETYADVLAVVRGLSTPDLKQLRLWIRGERMRSKLDTAFDRVR